MYPPCTGEPDTVLWVESLPARAAFDAVPLFALPPVSRHCALVRLMDCACVCGPFGLGWALWPRACYGSNSTGCSGAMVEMACL